MEHRERIGIKDRGLRIALYNPILYRQSSILYPLSSFLRKRLVAASQRRMLDILCVYESQFTKTG
jgi:hypothetical protein